MNILHINTHDTGGAGIACVRIHNALLEQNIDSKVLFRNKSKTNAPSTFEIWEELNDLQKVKKLAEQKILDQKQSKLKKKVKAVNELFTSFNSIWDITKSKLYLEADIIHLHWVAGFLDVPSFFKNCKKPIVWTLHDYAPFNNGLHYPNANEGVYDEDSKINANTIEEAITYTQPTIVTPSNYLKLKSQESTIFGDLNHLHIVNPIDSAAYYYQDKKIAKTKLNIPDDKKVIVFVTDEISYTRKGFDYLIKAIDQLNDDTIYSIAIGNNRGNEQINSAKINYVGQINFDEKLSTYYAAADLLVTPSLDDNLPNIIVEAHSCGTPVAAFNLGGTPEMIQDGINGLLAKEVTVEEFSKTIKIALTKVWDYEQIAKTAQKKYANETCAEEYIKIYQSL